MKIDDLSGYNVSSFVIDKLKEQGYQELTEVQTKAIEKGLFDSKNLVISAPTNTGKTFIGELASIVKTDKISFFLVPLKALAEEKYEDFKCKYKEWGLDIAISTSERTDDDENILGYNIIITTYEKFYALLIKYPHIIKYMNLIVIDELQNISDKSRGPTLEILLTKLITEIISEKIKPQIIGLSATIPNARELADWLEAELIETSKREVELREGIIYKGESNAKIDEYILSKGDFIYKEFNSNVISVERDLQLQNIERIRELSKKESMLIFVSTKQKSEEIAKRIAKYTPLADTQQLIDEIKNNVEPTPSTRKLIECLENEVAFHHAGLLPEERTIIEQGFKKGLIRILVSTTTLAQGVNTPAKNVIILDSNTYDKKPISVTSYKNMSGRAGRITSDRFGRSILLADDQREMEILWQQYITAKPERVESSLRNRNDLKKELLFILANNEYNKNDLLYFIKCSFFGYVYYKHNPEEFGKIFERLIEEQIEWLSENKFITYANNYLQLTELGRICAEELLLPTTVEFLIRYMKDIMNDYKNNIEGVIHLCCCTDDGKNVLIFEPNPSEREELQAYYDLN